MEDKYTDFQYWKKQYGSTPVEKLREEYNALRPQLKGRNALTGKDASILKAKVAALNWHLNEAARLPKGASRITPAQPTGKRVEVGRRPLTQSGFPAPQKLVQRNNQLTTKTEDIGKTTASQPGFTAGSGNKVAGTQVQTSSPRVIPGARGILEDRSIPQSSKSNALAIPQDLSGARITSNQPPAPPSQGALARIGGNQSPISPRQGALSKAPIDVEVLDDVINNARRASRPVRDFIETEVIQPAKSAIKALPPGVQTLPEELAKNTPRGMQWVKDKGRWLLIPALMVGAATLTKELLDRQKSKPQTTFTPDVAPPSAPPKQGGSNSVAPSSAPSQQGGSKPVAYPSQSKMSQAMDIGKGSNGVIDKANPADIKRAEGYMTDLMQRIAKGGWDQPGQERRGTQIGTPGSDKIVQMFKDSKYSDQFTQVEQEEAIKRFKANFARQSFKGSNAIPQGRTVTQTAKYTGSPERW